MTSKKSTLRRLVPYLRPYASIITVALLCGLVLAVVNPGFTFAMKFAMQALESRSPNLLLSAFLVFGALFLGDLVFRFLRNYLLRAAGERCLARLREQAFEAMVALPSSFYDTHPAGTLSSRFLFDAAAIPSAVEGLGYYVTSPLSLIGLLVVAFYQDWKLT